MRRWALPLVLITLLSAACTGGGGTNSTSTAGCTGKVSGGPVAVKAWYHSGTGVERDTLQSQVDAFNASQSAVKVQLVLLPEGNYNDQVKAAAASGGLPDILDFDGPFLYNYAWNRNLISLDSCISASLKANILPSLVSQGTYANHMYGVGTLDSGLGLYTRKSLLTKNGIRIPSGPQDAWTADEFTQLLKTLQAAGFKKPLDLKLNYGQTEWYTYGFSPIIQSAGADLIDRNKYQSANGVLNSQAAVQSLTVFQSWFKQGFVDFNEDDGAFIKGRSAISWVGHWMFADYRKAFGDDLVILPLPNFGKGSKTGMGSWQWGITSTAKNVDAAWAFMNFLLQDKQEIQFTTADGAVPGTKSAIAGSPSFARGGPEYVYVQQLLSTAVPRPQTPAYPTITVAFRKAIGDIINGGDVKAALDQAVQAIDTDIKDNDGYPVKA